MLVCTKGRHDYQTSLNSQLRKLRKPNVPHTKRQPSADVRQVFVENENAIWKRNPYKKFISLLKGCQPKIKELRKGK